MLTGIEEEIWKQSYDVGVETFICKTCTHYLKGCRCEKGIFIAFEGANLYGCRCWEPGDRCRHCGKIT